MPSLRIDLHTHILPESWPDLRARYGYGGFLRVEHHEPGRAWLLRDGEKFREIQQNCWDPDERLEDMERANIDVQVLSTVPVMFCYWAKPDDTLDLARLLNDHLASVVAAHPKRFVGLGTVPMQAPDLASGELERCVRELGMPGVQIGSHVNGRNLDHAEVVPVLETAAQLGAAVFVHPWDMLGRDRMAKYWLPWLVGMPAETALAVCSVIFGGVLDRNPSLRIGFAHGGGSFPGTLGRIEHGYVARPDLCAVGGASNPKSYIGRFFVDSAVHDTTGFRHLMEILGPTSIALGTDYPFPLGEQEPGRVIDDVGELSEDTRERLFAGTALEFLGLRGEDYTR